MAIFLDDAQVAELLDMESCIQALDQAFRERAEGAASNLPRRRLPFSERQFMIMAASMPRNGWAGYKTLGADTGPHVMLYKAGEGIVAFMRAGRLGHVRTGAATGLATRHMARADASRLGCFGTGHQAQTQILAVSKVRKLDSILVYSRDPQKRRAFAEKMTAMLNEQVRPVESAAEAVKGRDIIITMTNSSQPVFDGRLLEPGTHINAAGASTRTHRELDEIAVTRAGTIATDDIEGARIECGDLDWPVERGMLAWEKVHELAHIVAGLLPGRRSKDEITLYESQGTALEDVAAASLVYERALARGIGTPLPF